MLIKRRIQNCDGLQSYSYRPVTTLSEALSWKINFNSVSVFAICQIIPFENDVYVAKTQTI